MFKVILAILIVVIIFTFWLIIAKPRAAPLVHEQPPKESQFVPIDYSDSPAAQPNGKD